MGIIEPGPSALEGFSREVADDEPIVLINLLRYRQQADAPGRLTGR